MLGPQRGNVERDLALSSDDLMSVLGPIWAKYNTGVERARGQGCQGAEVSAAPGS